MRSVTAHTDIDEITEERLLQGCEGDGQEVINLKRCEIGPTYSVHATSSESVFEGGYKCFENVATRVCWNRSVSDMHRLRNVELLKVGKCCSSVILSFCMLSKNAEIHY